MTVYILWFVITLAPGHLMHIPVEKEFPTLAACVEEAETYWVPLLAAQFPLDKNLAVECLPFKIEKVKI